MPQRRGFTLVEVLVALVIMGIVTGAIYRLLATSQRVTLAQAEQVTLQSNVRTGSLVVPNELRELNTWVAGGVARNDVLVAQPNAIQYRAMRGLGFVCQAAIAGGTTIRIAAPSWTGIRGPDADRDNLYVFFDDDVDEDGDDQWLPVTLTGASALLANECGGGIAGYRLTAAAFPEVKVNTPVRVFEEMRLELYADAGEWWLGAQSMKVPGSVLQPVLGPLTNDGFALEYLDANGNVTAATDAIRSIRVIVRGLSDGEVRGGGGSGAMGHSQEALATQVLLRNSIRP